MIEFKDVSIKYVKEFFTLFNINCCFNGNTLIVGDINSGAYSLLRIISKIDKNYTGIVSLDGKDLRQIREKDLDIAYLPHEPVLFTRKSIYSNLAYPLKLRKYKKADINEKVSTYIDKYLNNFPKKIMDMDISQRKIVALVRAIMRKPKYLFVEDFFSNLDMKYLELVEKIFFELPNDIMIFACENEENNLNVFKNFKRYYLNFGTILTKKDN